MSRLTASIEMMARDASRVSGKVANAGGPSISMMAKMRQQAGRASMWVTKTNARKMAVGGGLIAGGGYMATRNRTGRAMDRTRGTPRGMYQF